MNSRFKENVFEILVFSSALDPKDGYVSFKVDDICKLANKFYLEDFTEQEKLHLKFQLELLNLIFIKILICKRCRQFQIVSSIGENK